MFSLNDSFRYWLWSEPTDMRKSFYTLSGLVRTKMGKDPLDGSVYVFINARRDRIKLLHMEPGGLVLYMKVLERGELHVPQRLSGPGTKTIEWRELVVMDVSTLADLEVQKFFYHMPHHRVIQQYKEAGVTVSSSTVNDWHNRTCDLLHPLYKRKKVAQFTSDP